MDVMELHTLILVQPLCSSIFEFTDGVWGVTTDKYGCTDNSALNYNPLATIEDGTTKKKVLY